MSDHKLLKSLPLRAPITTTISKPEDRFLHIAVLTGQFDGRAEALRHYFRQGLKAEGVYEEAIRCL